MIDRAQQIELYNQVAKNAAKMAEETKDDYLRQEFHRQCTQALHDSFAAAVLPNPTTSTQVARSLFRFLKKKHAPASLLQEAQALLVSIKSWDRLDELERTTDELSETRRELDAYRANELDGTNQTGG